MHIPSHGSTWLLLVSILSGWPTLASAQTVYRTVDEQGRVSFSDRPPDGADSAETLRVSPDRPSEEAVKAARERHEAVSKTADELAAKRRASEQEKRRQEAEKRKRELEKPQVIVIDHGASGPGYWPGHPVRPGRPIKPVRPQPPTARPPVNRPPAARPPAGQPPPPTTLPIGQ
ncbi:MAG: DUF4124 domain-containing protein [Gammaproteobacteria bacterium]|nr:MAG: DUF4124 domain-containing protein [Gammaproteobacteria bacterium]